MKSLAPAGSWHKPKKKKTEDGTLWTFKTSCCQSMFTWGFAEKPEACPYCGALYWHRGWHEYRLFNLQDLVKEERKECVLAELFDVLHDYARIMVAQTLKSSGGWLEREDFDMKCRELAYRVYDHVLKGSWINQSFGALLFRIQNGVLYGEADHDRTWSLDHKPTENAPSFSEYMASSEKLSKALEYEPDHLTTRKFSAENPMTEELMRGLEEVNEVIQANFGHHGSIQMLAGLHGKLTKKSLAFFSTFAEEFGNQAKQNVENATSLVFAHLIQLRDRSPDGAEAFMDLMVDQDPRTLDNARALLVAV